MRAGQVFQLRLAIRFLRVHAKTDRLFLWSSETIDMGPYLPNRVYLASGIYYVNLKACVKRQLNQIFFRASSNNWACKSSLLPFYP